MSGDTKRAVEEQLAAMAEGAEQFVGEDELRERASRAPSRAAARCA